MVATTTPYQKIHRYRPMSSFGFCMALILFLAACGRGGTGVANLRVGDGGNTEAFVGQPVPIAAQIKANTAIDHVNVDIRPVSGDGWVFNEQYNEGLSGTKETAFRVDVAVPVTAERGNYRLTLRLTESDGSVAEESTEFQISIDSTVPTASDLDVGINAAGNDLHIETELTAPSKIKQVIVEVKGDAWEKEFTFAGERLVGQLSHHFHEHVHVDEAPKGAYRVILTVEDQKGRHYQTEGTFTK